MPESELLQSWVGIYTAVYLPVLVYQMYVACYTDSAMKVSQTVGVSALNPDVVMELTVVISQQHLSVSVRKVMKVILVTLLLTTVSPVNVSTDCVPVNQMDSYVTAIVAGQVIR